MIIFSVSQDSSMDYNLDSHSRAVRALLECGEYEMVLQCHNGTVSVGYLTNQVDLGKQLATAANQTRHYEQGHRGKWYLVDTVTDKVLSSYRTFSLVSEDVAVQTKNWVQIAGKYYIAIN